MIKQTLILFAAALLFGTTSTLHAQTAPSHQRQGIVYYTPNQRTLTYSVRVESIEFAPEKTIVTLSYIARNGGANLLSSTKLVCRLRGGKTIALPIKSTCGIPLGKGKYKQLRQGDIFTAYFPALNPGEASKIKSLDFLEMSSGIMDGEPFNIYDIKINKKRLLIR